MVCCVFQSKNLTLILPPSITIPLSFCLGVFEDDDVTHVEGDVNPVRDLEIISEELRLKDQQYLANQLVRLQLRRPQKGFLSLFTALH